MAIFYTPFVVVFAVRNLLIDRLKIGHFQGCFEKETEENVVIFRVPTYFFSQKIRSFRRF